MKSPYLSELQPNQTVQGTFLVSYKDVRQKKSGDPYLSLTLSDRTGELDAKMWDNAAEALNTFERDDFVRVKGLLQVFQNRPQLTLHKIQPVPESEVDLADYLPASKRDRDEMFRELQGWIAGMSDPHLKHLLEAIFADEEIAQAYRTAPAAKTVHHNWIGGLIEHVLSLCNLAKATAAHYPHIDFDLLLTGVLLHDIGKIRELHYARSFGYTTEGQLLGHIQIGVQMVLDKLRADAGLSAAPAGSGGAHDPLASRGAGVRLAQNPAVSRGSAAASARQHGFEDGMHAGADRSGSADSGRMDRLQFGARSRGAEEEQISGWLPPEPAAETPAAKPASASARACVRVCR